MDDATLIKSALASGDPKLMRQALSLARDPLFKFYPRPDRPEAFDQQSSFFYDRFNGMACLLGGTGSGKSHVGSAKVAAFLNSTPPPEVNTPFWILSKTMDMVSGNCWGQNLAKFVPPDRIAGVVWYRKERGLPRSVMLKPHANGNNYVLEFKSYDMDRQALQAANIVGFWADEQIPYDILMEVWGRTRKWDFAGSKIYSLTPLEPDPKLEDIYAAPPASWKFYRLNTRLNDTLAAGFVKNIEDNEVGVLIETRLTGQFARYEGAVYPEFNPKVHVVEPVELPPNWLRVRGLDLGWSHATACVWAVRSPDGKYYVYREYLQAKSSVEDHVKAINDDWHGNPVRGHTYADPSAAQTLHEFAIRGLGTVPANKAVNAGIATVQSLLRPGPDGTPKLFVFNTCEQLVTQFKSYVWDVKAMDKPLKVNDDLIDSLRYLCHSHRMDNVVDCKPLRQPERRKVNF